MVETNWFTVEHRDKIWNNLIKQAKDRNYHVFESNPSIVFQNSTTSSNQILPQLPWDWEKLYLLGFKIPPPKTLEGGRADKKTDQNEMLQPTVKKATPLPLPIPILVWMVDPTKLKMAKGDMTIMLEQQFNIQPFGSSSSNSTSTAWKGPLILWIINCSFKYASHLKILIRDTYKRNRITIESFTYQEMVSDYLQSMVVPFQRPLTSLETKILKSKIGDDLSKFDKVKINDAICRHYGMSAGQVLLVQEASATNGMICEYLLVEK
jgi:DNA-directed RNA polymerase subunit H (RpoH/RPB5)